MTINICHCGAQSSYPHKKLCPFPLYNNGIGAVLKWTEMHKQNKNLSESKDHILTMFAGRTAQVESTAAGTLSFFPGKSPIWRVSLEDESVTEFTERNISSLKIEYGINGEVRLIITLMDRRQYA